MAAAKTVSDVFMETLHEQGIRYLFANLGTDYPSIVEALARPEAPGAPMPKVILCPHENTAITAAHGVALATGQGQGVFVHVGVGTQNLGGALTNAWCGRVPMLIFAGRAPQSTRGEYRTSRDSPIHYFQDVRDQAGILRQTTKWEFNLELPEQISYGVQRGARLMQSDPQGAVYMTAAREVLDMTAPDGPSDPPSWGALPKLGALSDEDARRIASALHGAERPLIITSYLGRHPEAVASLVALSDALQIPVMEPSPSHLNFPRDHPNHWGYRNAPAVREADFLLLVDTDVPWIPKYGGPAPGTPVVQLDLDPLKPHMVLWDFPVTESHQVAAPSALEAILQAVDNLPAAKSGARAARQDWTGKHRPATPQHSTDGKLTAAALSALLGRHMTPETVLFEEGITNADIIRQHTQSTKPGTYFGLPGGSLGWSGGAALGYKLARPEADVVAVVGDGSFLFNTPASLYMTAVRYGLPFLTVIYNNAGWNAVKASTDRVFGAEGQAARGDSYQHHLSPTDNLEQVATAFGCHGASVRSPEEVEPALREAGKAMAKGIPAVINAHLEPA